MNVLNNLQKFSKELPNNDPAPDAFRKEHVYRFGEFCLIPKKRLLLRAGTRVSLTPRSFDVLLVLVKNCHCLVRKGQLTEAVWKDANVEEANLSVQIAKLRKVFQEGRSKPYYIETVPKYGYRFVAGVTEEECSLLH